VERAPVPGRARPDHPFDFVDHRLVARTNRGQQGSFRLRDGLSVASFDHQLHQLLDRLGVDVAIREELTSSFCPSPAELQALYQHATTP
jgi:hypothetical protein